VIHVAATMPGVTVVDQDALSTENGLFDGAHYSANGYNEIGHLVSPEVARYCGLRIPPIASAAESAMSRAVSFTDTSTSPGNKIVSCSTSSGRRRIDGAELDTRLCSGRKLRLHVDRHDVAGDTSTSAPVTLNVSNGIAGLRRTHARTKYVPQTSGEWSLFFAGSVSSRIRPRTST